jgi:glycosyltransferase involved in cell wall biosynthesis
MFGVKGLPVPAGAENVVEQLGSRLVQRGHEVTVYVRSHYTPPHVKEYKGMRLVHLPSIRTKNLDAITHSFLATLAVLGSNVDIAHVHSTGSSIFAFLPRLRGIKTVVQSHGLDWQRAKWGRFARLYLRLTDYTTVHFPDRTTAVSRQLAAHYQSLTKKVVTYIPNGIVSGEAVTPQEIRQLGLNGNDYILFAARLVPEKGCHYLIEAYQALKQPKPKLVIAGDGVLGDPYAQELKKKYSSEQILFPGFVQGRLLEELLSNACVYVLPSEIEGLSVGLLEALSYGNCVLVSDIPENVEAVGDAGVTFQSRSSADLRAKLEILLRDEARVRSFRSRAKDAVAQKYNWDQITDEYEALYIAMLNPGVRQECSFEEKSAAR